MNSAVEIDNLYAFVIGGMTTSQENTHITVTIEQNNPCLVFNYVTFPFPFEELLDEY